MKNKLILTLLITIFIMMTLTACPGPSEQNGTEGQSSDGTETSTQNGDNSGDSEENPPSDTEEISLMDVGKGLEVWKRLTCTNCHRIGDDPGGDRGPNLTGIGDRYTKDELKNLISAPQSIKPDSTMPAQTMVEEDLEYLARYLSLLSSELRKD